MYIVEPKMYIYKCDIRSRVNEVIRTISDQFFFIFYKMIFYKSTIKRTENNKDNNCSRIETFKKGKIGYFVVRCFLYAQNLFVKKKPACNCPDNLIDYTTESKTY